MVTVPVPRPSSTRPRHGERRSSPSLALEAGNLLAFPGPRLILALAIAAWCLRLALGDWTGADLLPPLIVLALEPLTEWVIHVFVLHFRPRRLFGRQVDLYVARKHRAHHADPKDRLLVLIPFPVVVRMLVVGALLMWFLIPDHRIALTAMGSSFTMLAIYEWTHHLIHSPYRPKRGWYRYVWRAHRLHHFRNERYWFGVTVHAADHLLGTFPAKDNVTLSPTARALHGG